MSKVSRDAIEAAHRFFPQEFDDRRTQLGDLLQGLMDQRDEAVRDRTYWHAAAHGDELDLVRLELVHFRERAEKAEANLAVANAKLWYVKRKLVELIEGVK